MHGKLAEVLNSDDGRDCDIQARLEGITAIFKAIDAGELLSALPDCKFAQEHHKVALTLLAVVEREVFYLRTKLECGL